MELVRHLLPELAMVVGILIGLTNSMINGMTGRKARVIMIGWIVVVIIVTAASQNLHSLLFAGSYRIDSYSQFFKLLIAIGLFSNLVVGWPLRSIPRVQSPEYYMFFFSAGLGMMLLSSVYNFLVLYLSMELVSYSMYTMIAMRRDRTEAIESTVKYYLIGVAASATGLYGLSFVYGSVGGLGFAEMVHMLQTGSPGLMLAVGLVMVFSSFLFKLAAFPFHFWAPDAYEAADTPVSMFLATVGKLAGIAALFRIVYISLPYTNVMGIALGVIAFLTMSYGNFVAFRQKSAKRLFAYSSIAQAGYILLGMLGLQGSSPQAVLFYAVIYLFMNLAVFMVVIDEERARPDPSIESLHGLYARNPVMALTLLIALFSLAGVPPLSGFFGKWLLFTSAAEAGYGPLVVFAIINSVISLFYYLFLVKSAYYGPADEVFKHKPPLLLPRISAIVLALIILFLGIYPQPLLAYIANLNIAVTLLP